MKENKFIGFHVRMLNNQLVREMENDIRKMSNGQLTVMHSWIIGYLYRNREKELFQKDVEAEFCITRSTATNILQLMEKKGYIYKETVPYDERLKRLLLTERGIALAENHYNNILEKERQLKKGLTDEEVDMFLKTIEKIKKNVIISEEDEEQAFKKK